MRDELIMNAHKRAKEAGRREYITNDSAREYVANHYELRKAIVRASVWMFKARYEYELSKMLGEDGCEDHDTHFDKSFSNVMRAAKARDEAVALLEDARDIDRETYEWLRFTYLYEFATI